MAWVNIAKNVIIQTHRRHESDSKSFITASSGGIKHIKVINCHYKGIMQIALDIQLMGDSCIIDDILHDIGLKLSKNLGTY